MQIAFPPLINVTAQYGSVRKFGPVITIEVFVRGKTAQITLSEHEAEMLSEGLRRVLVEGEKSTAAVLPPVVLPKR